MSGVKFRVLCCSSSMLLRTRHVVHWKPKVASSLTNGQFHEKVNLEAEKLKSR